MFNFRKQTLTATSSVPTITISKVKLLTIQYHNSIFEILLKLISKLQVESNKDENVTTTGVSRNMSLRGTPEKPRSLFIQTNSDFKKNTMIDYAKK